MSSPSTLLFISQQILTGHCEKSLPSLHLFGPLCETEDSMFIQKIWSPYYSRRDATLLYTTFNLGFSWKLTLVHTLSSWGFFHCYFKHLVLIPFQKQDSGVSMPKSYVARLRDVATISCLKWISVTLEPRTNKQKVVTNFYPFAAEPLCMFWTLGIACGAFLCMYFSSTL